MVCLCLYTQTTDTNLRVNGFKDFLSENGIIHHRTTPLLSQADEEVDRQNRSMMKRIRIAQAEGRD